MIKSKESNPIKLYRGRIMHTEHSKYWMYINQINTMPMNILLPSFQINSHLESIKNLGKGKVVWISWVKFKLLLNIPEVLRWCFINNNNIQTIKCWFLFKVLIYRKFPYMCKCSSQISSEHMYLLHLDVVFCRSVWLLALLLL